MIGYAKLIDIIHTFYAKTARLVVLYVQKIYWSSLGVWWCAKDIKTGISKTDLEKFETNAIMPSYVSCSNHLKLDTYKDSPGLNQLSWLL